MLPACCELYFSVRRILIFICKRSPSRVVVLGLERLSKSDCGEAVVASSHNGLSSRVRGRATISQYWIKATRAALWPGKVRPGKEWREGGRQQLGPYLVPGGYSWQTMGSHLHSDWLPYLMLPTARWPHTVCQK